jgi:glycosyltransferase involved in cell wall biosynthesis
MGGAPGGVATHQAHLARGLAAAGVDASLLATNVAAAVLDEVPIAQPVPTYRMWVPRRWADWVDPRYARAVGPRRLVRYAAFAARQSPGALTASRRVLLGNLLWYARFIRAVRPDVVHVQHPLERQLYVRLFRQLEGSPLPVVVTLHSLFGEHSDAIIHGLMAPNLAFADCLIAVNTHIAQQAIQLGADPGRIRVIRSGVDVEHFRPIRRESARASLGLPADRPIVLFVGTLEPRKQVDRLLRALPAVRQVFPSVLCALIGTGELVGAEDQLPVLRRLVDELALGASVRFAGRVSEDELVRWYSAADIFALPSSAEGQGIAALEAMACGLPVVASAVGGLLTTIQEGVTGWLVASGDVPVLAERLIGVLGDPSLRARIGAAAREAARQHFSWGNTVAQTMQVYHDVARTIS